MKNLFQGDLVDRFMSDKSSLENIYYKVKCYYNAKAEQYIKTSLLSFNGDDEFIKYYINTLIAYAHSELEMLEEQCINILIKETKHPFDYGMWMWINGLYIESRNLHTEYERMKSNGELDFIEKYNK